MAEALPEGSQLPAFSQNSLESNYVSHMPVEGGQVDKTHLASPSQESLQHISSRFHNALRLDTVPQKNGAEEKIITESANHVLERQGSTSEQTHSHVDTSSVSAVPRAVSSSSEAALLDERSLLACIVRTIPPGSGGKIRISSKV